MPKQVSKDVQFWLASLIIAVTVIFSVANYLRIFDLHFAVDLWIANLYSHHWMSVAGALFIAIATPLYRFLKQRSPKKYSSLLKMHIFGNLLAFLLVSIHFSQQIGRPAAFFPELGTGLVLYITVILLVATGFLQRFPLIRGMIKKWRFLHVSTTLTFYLVVIVHILHNFGII